MPLRWRSRPQTGRSLFRCCKLSCREAHQKNCPAPVSAGCVGSSAPFSPFAGVHFAAAILPGSAAQYQMPRS